MSAKQEYKIYFLTMYQLDFLVRAKAVETVSIVSMETMLVPNNSIFNQEVIRGKRLQHIYSNTCHLPATGTKRSSFIGFGLLEIFMVGK